MKKGTFPMEPEIISTDAFECTGVSSREGDLLPLTPGELIISGINADDLARAAAVLRQADFLTQPTLSALADLLGGDARKDPTLSDRYPYRLSTASWGLPGRKRKGGRARAKSPHKRKSKIRPSDAMITAKVRTKMDLDGKLGKAAAVAAVATELTISRSLVAKAFSSYKRRMRISVIERKCQRSSST